MATGYIESDLTIAIGDPRCPLGPDGLFDEETGEPINNASVTLESVKDATSGAAVAGVTVPATLDYIDGSRGVYKGRIPAAASISDGQTVEAKFKAVVSGTTRVFYLQVTYQKG